MVLNKGNYSAVKKIAAKSDAGTRKNMLNMNLQSVY